MADTVTRKVHFLRAYRGLDDAGMPIDFTPRPALQAIAQLDFAAGHAYLDEQDGNVLCCWIDRHDRLPYRARLARVRRGALPQLERRGRLSPLNIPAESGLAEQVHVSFFPDNIVGFLYNHFGPRVTRLATYLKDKTGVNAQNVRFDPLLKPDILAEIDRVQEIKMVSLRLRRAAADAVSEMNETLGDVLRGAADLGSAERVELILQPEAHSRHGLGATAIDFVRRLARREEVDRVADRFTIDARTDAGLETIDLLSGYIVSEQSVVMVDDRTRALNDASAYAGIERAYNQLREQIIGAATVWSPSAS